MEDILNSVCHIFLTAFTVFIANIACLTKILAFIVIVLQMIYWFNKVYKGVKK